MSQVTTVYTMKPNGFPLVLANFSSEEEAMFFCEELEEEQPETDFWMETVDFNPEVHDWYKYVGI